MSLYSLSFIWVSCPGSGIQFGTFSLLLQIGSQLRKNDNFYETKSVEYGEVKEEGILQMGVMRLIT